MTEKRTHQRIDKPLVVRFRFLRSHLGMSSRSEDISEIGIRLVTLQRLLPGMQVDMTFQLGEFRAPITATAEVMWQRERDNIYYPFVVGLKFVKIKPDDREKIRNYINLSDKEGQLTIHKEDK